MKNKLPIALSNRHCHLTQEHVDKLFGKGYQLNKYKDLSQPGQYACKEKVEIIGPKDSLPGVRILGPVRDHTQVEVLISDGFKLGVKPPIKNSGDLKNSPGVALKTEKGTVDLDRGLIVAARHIHMHPNDAKNFGVKDNDKVNIEVERNRGLIFKNVLIRVSSKYALEMHVDLEEGNAAAVKNGTMVKLIK